MPDISHPFSSGVRKPLACSDRLLVKQRLLLLARAPSLRCGKTSCLRHTFRYFLDNKGGVNGLHLLAYCDTLASLIGRSKQGQALLPSAERIFYYTRRFMIARGISPEVNPDEILLPEAVVERFLQEAPVVGERLAAGYPCAVRLRAEPGPQLRHILSKGPLLSAPKLKCSPGYPAEVCAQVQSAWEYLWKACWRAAEQEHLARLWVFVSSDRLLVAPIARPDDDPYVALRFLRDRLALDAAQSKTIAPQSYLYNVPLEAWLLESLLTGRWLFQLCQSLAELSRQVPELVGRRQGVSNSNSPGGSTTAQEESNPGPVLAPESATADDFFAAGVLAWQQSLDAPGAAPLLPDEQKLPAEQFQKLLAAAVQVVEQFLLG